MKKTIFIKSYPATFCFETNIELPEFTYGCETRTEILHREMIKQKIKSPYHHVSDYIVEDANPVNNTDDEIWNIGS